MQSPWVPTVSLLDMSSTALTTQGEVFEHGGFTYRTTGIRLGAGGMGAVYNMERRHGGVGPIEQVVGKVFHANYLLQIRTDDVTRRDHQTNITALARIGAIQHPNVLPIYVAAQIADNFLFITPLMGQTLLEAVHQSQLSPRARVQLLLQALEGLSAMHDARVVHRDLTLRNILLDERGLIACLFDFDLALSLDDVGEVTYREHYRGRVFGSPGWSVPPETIDQTMQDAVLSPLVDVYAAGSALHALFTDELLYGAADDMWALLFRIGEGVVVGGVSRVHYPESVPLALRPIIDRCLERDPDLRYPTVAVLATAIRGVLRDLSNVADHEPGTRDATGVQVPSIPVGALPEIGEADRRRAERAVWNWDYQVEQPLGTVKGHPIYLAVPRSDLITSGRFPDQNTFPKLVTVIDLEKVSDARGLVDAWQRHYLPILRKVRRAPLTALHKVIYDAETKTLLLFSEYIDAPRFGDALSQLDIPLDGAAALSFVVIRQIAALHEHGMAHHNVSPRALMFKGGSDLRIATPAMLGLVEPAMGAEAMAEDCRALSGLMATWMRPERVAAVPSRLRPMIEAMRRRLTSWAFDPEAPSPGIDDLMALSSDALALLDFNFSVLRDAGGDLVDYAQLLFSHRAYHLLWPTES